MDRLAAEGVRFEHAVSNEPVCMAARSMLLSGQYARTCVGHVSNTGWPGGVPFWSAGFPLWPRKERWGMPQATMPELLQRAGYATHAVGKWHIDSWPDRIGFDHYTIAAHHHAHVAQRFITDGGLPYSHEGWSVDHEARIVEELFASARGTEQPFFLYYNISPPHMPLDEAPERYKQMYGEGDVITRPNVAMDETTAAFDWHMRTYLWDYRYYRDHMPHTRALPAGMSLKKLTAMYMGLTTWVDDVLGRMMASLAAVGLRDDTIVVFTSDHGDNLGSQGRMGKATLNEESIRVPLMVAGPGIREQHNKEQVASLADLAPTLLACAGIAPPPHMAGQDLGCILRGERATAARAHAFIETVGDGVGIRTPTHLLGLPWVGDTRSIGEAPHYFTDLRDDAYQLNRGRKDQADTREGLMRLLAEWDRQTAWMTSGERRGPE